MDVINEAGDEIRIKSNGLVIRELLESLDNVDGEVLPSATLERGRRGDGEGRVNPLYERDAFREVHKREHNPANLRGLEGESARSGELVKAGLEKLEEFPRSRGCGGCLDPGRIGAGDKGRPRGVSRESAEAANKSGGSVFTDIVPERRWVATMIETRRKLNILQRQLRLTIGDAQDEQG